MNKYDAKNKKLVDAWKSTDSVMVKREIENMLVKYNKPFIHTFIAGKADDLQESRDLFNECAKSIVSRLEKFDPINGQVKFITYWAWGMRKALTDYFYWKTKYSIEITDCTIMSKNHTEDGGYGIMNNIPSYDKSYEFSVDDILDVKVLNTRDKDILKKFYAMDLNQEQIGQLLCVSGSRIQQLMEPALEKLHRYYKCRESKFIKFADTFKMHRTSYRSTRGKRRSNRTLTHAVGLD